MTGVHKIVKGQEAAFARLLLGDAQVGHELVHGEQFPLEEGVEFVG